jgi:hypothetical protein
MQAKWEWEMPKPAMQYYVANKNMCKHALTASLVDPNRTDRNAPQGKFSFTVKMADYKGATVYFSGDDGTYFDSIDEAKEAAEIYYRENY